MKRYHYPFEQDALQAYSKFLLHHKLDELSEYQVRIAFEYDIPLLEKLKHVPHDQLLALTKTGYIEYLQYFVEGRPEDQINESLEKWNADNLEIVGKYDIDVRDITLINDVRETSMCVFIPEFTDDPVLQEKIKKQLHRFIVESNTSGFEAYVDILKQKIERQEKQLLEAQSIAKVGSFEWDMVNDKSFHTPELRKIFGLSGQGYNNWMERVHPEDRKRIEHGIEESYKTGYYDAQYRYLADGEEKNLWSKGQVLFDANGKPTLMRGTVQDITEWKKITEELQAAIHEKSQLTLLNLYKDEFLNIASHELKTPLTGIKAYLQLTRNIEKDPQALHFVHKSLSHVLKLEKLVADLLDTSKLNAGKLVYNKEVFDISVQVQEVCSQFSINYPGREIEMNIDSAAYIFGDKLRIEQVLNNLVENALKYSKEKVTVQVFVREGISHISVCDRGIGISEENKLHLFSRFYRSPEVTYSHQGLGLGLYISSKIIEQHDGKIELESKLNEGSCFTIHLPEYVVMENRELQSTQV